MGNQRLLLLIFTLLFYFHSYSNLVDGYSILDGFDFTMMDSTLLDDGGVLNATDNVVNVDDFGAKGDGSDDTEVLPAFQKAWNATCSSAPSILIVTGRKTYLVKQITFSGPCKSRVTMRLEGTIEAPSDTSAWNGLNRRQWILFDGIQDLTIEGGGTINGNGQKWWDNSCKVNKSLPCTGAPTALTLNKDDRLNVRNIFIKDSPQIQVSVERCVGVNFYNVTITAPDVSPNTDGIHITSTQNIVITSSNVGTGDDCISIESGSQNVTAINLTCGPGHGISIGSLGDGNSEAHVSQVTVDEANFIGTTNGVRIKTYQGGSGDATNITFQNIQMNNVQRPIIIDQYYCDSEKPCPIQPKAVKISNVRYRNITGTSATKVAVTFNCSTSVACTGIELQDIDLVGNGATTTTAQCTNAIGSTSGEMVPPSCLDDPTPLYKYSSI